jgi:hypothetical protein
MKKITAVLGASHSDFEKQLKELLNEMSDVIDNIVSEQQIITEYQNKLFLKQHAEVLQSSLCDVCHQKAEIIAIRLTDGIYESFCSRCTAS